MAGAGAGDGRVATASPGWAKSRTTICPALYHAADLFVLPASHPSEAFGLVQVEAMAAGLPVVCTELGTGTTYVNLDGVTGLVVPPRNPDALAGAINALIADPARRARHGPRRPGTAWRRSSIST